MIVKASTKIQTPWGPWAKPTLFHPQPGVKICLPEETCMRDVCYVPVGSWESIRQNYEAAFSTSARGTSSKERDVVSHRHITANYLDRVGIVTRRFTGPGVYGADLKSTISMLSDIFSRKIHPHFVDGRQYYSIRVAGSKSSIERGLLINSRWFDRYLPISFESSRRPVVGFCTSLMSSGATHDHVKKISNIFFG